MGAAPSADRISSMESIGFDGAKRTVPDFFTPHHGRGPEAHRAAFGREGQTYQRSRTGCPSDRGHTWRTRAERASMIGSHRSRGETGFRRLPRCKIRHTARIRDLSS